jgi:hypothetical protein
MVLPSLDIHRFYVITRGFWVRGRFLNFSVGKIIGRVDPLSWVSIA